MQGSAKYISAFLLIIFSFFTLGNIGIFNNDAVLQTSEKHTSCFEQLSPTLFVANFNKDKASRSTSKNPVSENKFSSQDLNFSTLEYTFKILIAAFNRMYDQSGNYPAKYRKSDIIFPFHYFW